MAVWCRPMRANDVRECVEIVAADPIVGPRYGSAIADLGPAWLRVFYSDGISAAGIVEETNGAAANMLAVAITVFVDDAFLQEAKAPPQFWVGPELARRIMRGISPVLSPRQVREANARGGLNLMYWQVTGRADGLSRADVRGALMAAFLDRHRGYQLKEVVVQAESTEHLLRRRNAGGLLWNSCEGGYTEQWPDNLDAVVAKPHLIGMTRQLALARAGSWFGSLFLLYQPPRFGFSRSEQRLLITAMQGSTDQELSDELVISLDTVKKTWRSIYERVAACLPELIPGDIAADDGTNTRGKQKKQRLIAYLHDHPEELRPVSRKLLQAGATQSRHSQPGNTVP
jgi:DNA-binding CsgD family transcriptional regulator